MRKGLAHDLTFWLRTRGDWIQKNDICRIEFPTPKKGLYGADLVSRTLRRLEEESVIAVKYVGGAACYKYVPEPMRFMYIPTSQRTNEQLWNKELATQS